MDKLYNFAYIPNQVKGHLRLGVSNWGRMEPRCLSNYNCSVGYELEIFRFLMIMLNFTVEIKYSNKPGCGNMDANGTWNGLLGMLQRDEIDVIGNLCQIDESRRNVSWLKYSWPVQLQKQAFLIKAPQLDFDFNLSAPFSSSIWLLLCTIEFIFIVLFAIVYKLYDGKSVARSAYMAVNDFGKLYFGMDCTLVRFDWFCCLCFIGYTQLLYSILVTIAVIKPEDIHRPFKNHGELADKLVAGTYKLLDYHSVSSYVQCEAKDACGKFLLAEHLHDHFIFNSMSMEHDNATDALLQTLVDSPNLVLVRSRYILRTYLDKFQNRSKLWLIDDEASGFEMFAYSYHKNCVRCKLFNRVLIMMSDSKDTIKKRYTQLADHAVLTKKISGSLSETSAITVYMLNGHWLFQSVAVTFYLFVFMLELLSVRFEFLKPETL